jgi:hypothetical protein
MGFWEIGIKKQIVGMQKVRYERPEGWPYLPVIQQMGWICFKILNDPIG